MKTLKTNSFLSERVKIKPITNAELDKARQEMCRFIKIENPTYNDIKEGRIVCTMVCDKLYSTFNEKRIYIVFNPMKLPSYCHEIEIDTKGECKEHEGNMIFLCYNCTDNRISYGNSYMYENNFPFNKWHDVRITAIYDTNINIMNITSVDDFKKVYGEVCEKIQNKQ